jgi:hypothetical protein
MARVRYAIAYLTDKEIEIVMVLVGWLNSANVSAYRYTYDQHLIGMTGN